MMDATGAFEENDAMSPDDAARWMVDGLVEGKQKLIRGTDKRRYILSTLAPRTLTRLVNVVYRIYADNPEAFPELEMDRALAQSPAKAA